MTKTISRLQDLPLARFDNLVLACISARNHQKKRQFCTRLTLSDGQRFIESLLISVIGSSPSTLGEEHGVQQCTIANLTSHHDTCRRSRRIPFLLLSPRCLSTGMHWCVHESVSGHLRQQLLLHGQHAVLLKFEVLCPYQPVNAQLALPCMTADNSPLAHG